MHCGGECRLLPLAQYARDANNYYYAILIVFSRGPPLCGSCVVETNVLLSIYMVRVSNNPIKL